MSTLSLVSVIVPVFNDEGRLGKCLAALNRQTYDQSQFEIIVVDNGSDDLGAIKDAIESYENVTLCHESTPGSYAARNRGLTIAKGEIIAFTDADCIPAPDWLERGIFHLNNNHSCGQVVGKVNLFFADSQNPNLVEIYESLTVFPQEQLLKDTHGGATANVFTWRRVIDHVGAFDPQLKSHGDLEWGKRVFEAGYSQVYAPDVQVDHPARRSFDEVHRRTLRLAGGAFDRLVRSEKSFIQRQKVFARLVIRDLIPPVSFVVKAFRSPDLKHYQEKLTVALMRFYVRYVSAGEKIRLKFGGTSKRA